MACIVMAYIVMAAEDSSSGSGVEKTLKLARLLPIVAAGAAVVAVAITNAP